jgi:hypothetical protein
VLLPGCLEAIGHVAEFRPDIDIITTDAYLDLDGEIVGRYYRGSARFATENQRRAAIHNQFVLGQSAVRREKWLAVGGFDESIIGNGDTDFFLRLILGGARAGLVDEPLFLYRLRGDSLSASRARGMINDVAILEKARSHPSVSDDERRFLDRELRAKRVDAALTAAEAALRGEFPHPRRRSLAVAFGRSRFGWRARLNGLTAAAAPRAAARALEARERRTGRSRLATQTRGR